MTVSPDDLTEAFHMVVADGAEPLSWKLPAPLWDQVIDRANRNGQFMEDDPASVERTLLGAPVEIAESPDHAPTLYVIRDGQRETVPIVGSLDEIG